MPNFVCETHSLLGNKRLHAIGVNRYDLVRRWK